MISRLRRWWTDAWFAVDAHHHYGIVRFVFVGLFFFLPMQSSRLGILQAYADAPASVAQPVLLLRLLHLPLPAPTWVGSVLVVLALAATIGVATRLSLVLLAGLYLYAGSAVNSFGFIAHDTTVPMILILVLAAAPGVTSFSVDAYLRERHDRRRGREPARRWSGIGAQVPVWPARLMLVFLALVYFSSGYAKVRESGLAWADGKTLQAYATDPQPAPYYLADDDRPVDDFRDRVGIESFLYSSGDPTPLLRRLADSSTIMAIIAISSLLWELAFPIVLFVRRLVPWFLLAGLAFHVTVALSFRLTSFYSYPLAYLIFVDWNGLIARVRPASASPASAGASAGS